jgi:FtsH-binding integral membrane protein
MFGMMIAYGIYLVVDMQMIIGGKHGEISLDDYIGGSIIIYTDIVRIFLWLL